MKRYKYESVIETNLEPEEIEFILRRRLQKKGIEIESMQITERKKSGRPLKNDPKFEQWLLRRTKPFTAKTFAQYMGLSNSSAWRRLERAVRAGIMTKSKRAGSVEYEIVR